MAWPPSFVTTGIPTVGSVTAGLQPGDLMIATAGSGVGKTAFAARVAMHVTKQQGLPVLFLCGQPAEEISCRMVAGVTALSLSKVRLRLVNPADGGLVHRAKASLKEVPLTITDASSLDVGGIRRQVACWATNVRGGETGLVVIDSFRDRRAVPSASADVHLAKEIAIRHRVPVLATLDSTALRGLELPVQRAASVHIAIRRRPTFDVMDDVDLAELDIADSRTAKRTVVGTPFSKELAWFIA